MTASFGERLRSHRERRGIALDTIAQSTKIGVGMLEGLERNDTSHWPSGIFRRAFIRAYAGAIGLDPESTLSEFLEGFPDPKDEESAWPRDGSRTHVVPLPSRSVRAEPLRLTLADRGSESVHESARTHTVLPPALDLVGEPIRLTLAAEPSPSLRPTVRALHGPWLRVLAALCDLGIVLAIVGAVFAIAGVFWTPFTVTTVCYYFGGVLMVNTSPAAWVIGRLHRTSVPGPHAEAPGPHAEAPGPRAEAPELRFPLEAISQTSQRNEAASQV
jgi:transcriptional regulator with XRE-family HTH domain